MSFTFSRRAPGGRGRAPGAAWAQTPNLREAERTNGESPLWYAAGHAPPCPAGPLRPPRRAPCAFPPEKRQEFPIVNGRPPRASPGTGPPQARKRPGSPVSGERAGGSPGSRLRATVHDGKFLAFPARFPARASAASVEGDPPPAAHAHATLQNTPPHGHAQDGTPLQPGQAPGAVWAPPPNLREAECTNGESPLWYAGSHPRPRQAPRGILRLRR